MVDTNVNILITGANGFVGKNLVCELKNKGFNNLFLYDIDTEIENLEEYVKKANFVFVSIYISLANSFLEEFFFRGFSFFTLKKFSNMNFAYKEDSDYMDSIPLLEGGI